MHGRAGVVGVWVLVSWRVGARQVASGCSSDGMGARQVARMLVAVSWCVGACPQLVWVLVS